MRFLRIYNKETIAELTLPEPHSESVHVMHREAVGIALPQTEFAQLALATVQDVSAPYLVHHCMRTFFFGCLLGRGQKLEFDREIFFVACALHDLGLTQAHRGSLPFELEGAEAAKTILLRAGFPERSADLVWDGIAMHTLTLADFKRPEIRLVSAGAAADVTGFGLDQIREEDVRDVLLNFPRLGMKGMFVGTCAEVAAAFPLAATRSFMRDIAERFVEGFEPPMIQRNAVASNSAAVGDRMRIAAF
jgi:hypothetical protein